MINIMDFNYFDIIKIVVSVACGYAAKFVFDFFIEKISLTKEIKRLTDKIENQLNESEKRFIDIDEKIKNIYELTEEHERKLSENQHCTLFNNKQLIEKLELYFNRKDFKKSILDNIEKTHLLKVRNVDIDQPMVNLLTKGRDDCKNIAIKIIDGSVYDFETLKIEFDLIFDELKILADNHIHLKDDAKFSKLLKADNQINTAIAIFINELVGISKKEYNGHSDQVLTNSILKYMETFYNNSIKIWRANKI